MKVRMRHLPLALAAIVMAGLTACDKVGDPIEAIGGRRPPPDEFRVLPRKPLQVPETFATASLPAPEPGRPSPLTPDPNTEAVAALLGEGVSPRPTATASLSAGESALLNAAGTSSSSAEIRYQLESDRAEAEAAEAKKPYEPPSLAELFLGSDDEEEEADPEIVLDAIGESQRLQRDGVAAPNDPLAAAPEPDAPRSEPVQSVYDPTQDRRPNNRIQVEGTGPAFE